MDNQTGETSYSATAPEMLAIQPDGKNLPVADGLELAYAEESFDNKNAEPDGIECPNCGEHNLHEHVFCAACRHPLQQRTLPPVAYDQVKRSLWVFAAFGLAVVIGSVYSALADATLFIMGLLEMFVVLILGWHYKAELKQLFRLNQTVSVQFLAMVAGGAFVFALGLHELMDWVLSNLDSEIFTDRELGLSHYDSTIEILLSFAAIAVLVPIAEEVIFRGVYMHVLQPIAGLPLTLVTQAILFGLVHHSPFSLLWLVPWAIAIGWIRNRTGSLLPGIVIHMVHNGTMVALFYFFSE